MILFRKLLSCLCDIEINSLHCGVGEGNIVLKQEDLDACSSLYEKYSLVFKRDFSVPLTLSVGDSIFILAGMPV